MRSPDGRAYFVLGRQTRTAQWSDFGGARASETETAEACAAREFVEESWSPCGFTIMPWSIREPPEPSRDFFQNTIQLRLERRQYLLRANLSRNPHMERGFSCFVVDMPWDPGCVDRFRERRCVGELDRIALLSVDRLARALMSRESLFVLRRSFLEAGELILRELATTVDRSAFAPRLLESSAWEQADGAAGAAGAAAAAGASTRVNEPRGARRRGASRRGPFRR